MTVENVINQIIDCLAQFGPYIEDNVVECKERDYAVQRLNEAVFWLTYLLKQGEEEWLITEYMVIIDNLAGNY